MMKEYKVKLTITGEKEFAVSANNPNEAMLKGVRISSSEPEFSIARDGIKSISGCLENTQIDPVSSHYSDCDDCIYLCEKCKSCTYVEDEDEYTDDEFELRKQIFKDYISDKIDEVIAYGRDLFEVE